MAKSTEIPDDSNGEDQIKNPKEEEETPKELVANNGASNPFPFPDEITESIIARVGRCNYPNISLVSKYFRPFITPPEIYKTRHRLGVTESVLYVMIDLHPYGNPSWYILDTSKIDSFRLGRITSLLPLRFGSSVVTVGSNMYIIGGYNTKNIGSEDVICFDCVSHTFHLLPHIRRARIRAAAGFIDGKIYVIGGCQKEGDDWVEVFNLETQDWSPVPGPYSKASPEGDFGTYMVMKEKIYILGICKWFSYEPKQDSWETWPGGYEFCHLWHRSSCVIDDMLYSINFEFFPEIKFSVYDQNSGCSRHVNGLHHRINLPVDLVGLESKMVNLDGKLVVILGGSHDSESSKLPYGIWYIEISLERRENGEIWGKVESVKRLLSSSNLPSIELCGTVTV